MTKPVRSEATYSELQDKICPAEYVEGLNYSEKVIIKGPFRRTFLSLSIS